MATVGEYPLPTNLVAGLELDPTPERKAWVAALPRLVPEYAARWGLTLGEPFQPGGQCSWVAPARDPAGDDLVLKLGWWHWEGEHEATALRLWDGDGAVRVVAEQHDRPTSALLLERCRPGTPLAELAAEPEQDLVVAGLLRRLWRHPPAGGPLRPLSVMADAWADEAAREHAARPGLLDPGLVRSGLDLMRELPSTGPDPRVLCTDLHAENILAAQREQWLVIDPKPFVGDPAYDLTQHLLNCPARISADPAGTAARMASLTGLDADRARLWLFARAVQEAWLMPWTADVARGLAPA